MSLYLCAFSFNDEIEEEEFGVEVGSYEYFGTFRDYIRKNIKNGDNNLLLLKHSDCDGIVEPFESKKIINELKKIKKVLKKIQPEKNVIELRENIISQDINMYQSLYDCFTDVDGVNLIDRLMELFQYSAKNKLDVFFQ